MKKAIMSAHVRMGETKNIGDYNQAIAARQFMNTSEFIDRDELHSYSGDVSKIILNGWFMHNPEEFPPSDKIVPLITSFHISPRKAEKILANGGLSYLKKHEPIGCRDKKTLEFLRGKGVKAFFSGCLTLTLGRTYKNAPSKTHALFVDPVFPMTDRITWAKLFNLPIILFVVLNIRKISKLSLKFRTCYFDLKGLKGCVRSLFAAAAFLKKYKTRFSEELLLSADYTSNIVLWKEFDQNRNIDQQLMDRADRTLRLYEQYPLVITSRIHCALPCTAMGTPVVFINDSLGRCTMGGINMGDGRFDGLLDFFNVMDFTEDWQLEPRGWHGDSVSISTKLPEKDNWRVYAEHLTAQCEKFASDGENI